MAVLYFAVFLPRGGLDCRGAQARLVIVVLFVGSALFWSGYEQAGSSLNLFAERYTDRVVGWLHFVIPAGWFQVAEPGLHHHVRAGRSRGLGSRWRGAISIRRRPRNSPSASMLMGSGFLVMAAAAAIVAGGSKVLPYWLILTYLLHTFGELCLSPVGLSYCTKLAPKRFVGQMMGMWFLSLSLGNLVAGLIAGEFDANNVAAMPGAIHAHRLLSRWVWAPCCWPQPSREKIDGQRAMTRASQPPAPQLTLKAIVLSIILTVILASANAYVGLFAGLTVATAIPAAVISMAVLPLFGRSNILENNIVATGASAGTSISAGAIFTLPALILLHHWTSFDYLVDVDHRRLGRPARRSVFGAAAPHADHRAEAASFPKASPRPKCSK